MGLLILLFASLSTASPLLWKENMSEPSRGIAIVRRSDRGIITHPETGQQIVVGTTSANGTVFAVVSMFCGMVLSYLLGTYRNFVCGQLHSQRES